MNVSVIGCGRWGSFIAWYLNSIGHDVILYGKMSNPQFVHLMETRSTGIITLPESLRLSANLAETLTHADTVVISVGAQALRGLCAELSSHPIDGKRFVLCMKGVEVGTGMRLTEVIADCLDHRVKTAVWVGPGHVQDFSAGIPNCMVIDSMDEDLKRELVSCFCSDLIRFYYGTDLIGTEIGAAAKNVIGIAAGMLDGLGVSSLKGALMSRGTREIARLIEALGGKAESAYGLAHLGDYEATLFSAHSHNRRFGELFVSGGEYGELAEGVATVTALLELSKRCGVELPICQAVDAVIHGGQNPKEALTSLFVRSIKEEF